MKVHMKQSDAQYFLSYLGNLWSAELDDEETGKFVGMRYALSELGLLSTITDSKCPKELTNEVEVAVVENLKRKYQANLINIAWNLSIASGIQHVFQILQIPLNDMRFATTTDIANGEDPIK